MKEEEQILELLRNAYREVKQRDLEFTVDSSLRDDLGIDSLDSIDILSVIEEQTGVTIDGSALEELGAGASVRDFVGFLQGRMGIQAE